MQWPWSRRRETALVSVSDPYAAAAAGWIDLGDSTAGVPVNESTALGVSAVWRAISLISGTMGMLNLDTLDENGDKSKSIFDNPGSEAGQTPFAWKETGFAHLTLHGRGYAWKVRNTAGAIVALTWLHPLTVLESLPTIEEMRDPDLRPLGGLWFTITLETGDKVRTDARDILYVPALSLDGVRGVSPMTFQRVSLGGAVAGDRAAAKQWKNGAMIAGIVSPQDDHDDWDVKKIRSELDRTITGWDNAAKLAIVNRRLQFSPWTMSNADAQFLESRKFSIEEISRWYGVPPHLLMQTEKQTSWGTGVEEQNRAMGRTVLGPWGVRFEQNGSRMLRGRSLRFDFSTLERPAPDKERELIRADYDAGLITQNEARLRMGLKAVDGGDVFKTATAPAESPAAPADDTEGDPDEDS